MKRTRFFLISGHKMYKILDLANNEPIWHQKDARGGFRGMRKVLPGKSLMLSLKDTTVILHFRLKMYNFNF